MPKPIPLAVGEPAPDFTLEAIGGRQVSLGGFRGKKHVVLTFYPKNNTAG
jgi:peroxiredoxin Q/BCP